MTEQPAPYRIARPAALVDDYSELGEQLQQTDEHYFGCVPGQSCCLACADWLARVESLL